MANSVIAGKIEQLQDQWLRAERDVKEQLGYPTNKEYFNNVPVETVTLFFRRAYSDAMSYCRHLYSSNGKLEFRAEQEKTEKIARTLQHHREFECAKADKERLQERFNKVSREKGKLECVKEALEDEIKTLEYENRELEKESDDMEEDRNSLLKENEKLWKGKGHLKHIIKALRQECDAQKRAFQDKKSILVGMKMLEKKNKKLKEENKKLKEKGRLEEEMSNAMDIDPNTGQFVSVVPRASDIFEMSPEEDRFQKWLYTRFCETQEHGWTV